MKPVTLSKSSFGAGRQCHKRLWIEKNNPDLVPKPSTSQEAIFDQGHEVGSWSHHLFPDGILLSNELDFAAHLQASREALSLRKPLFEPAFAIPGAYARADILSPYGEIGWELLEVKSASNVWDKSGQIKSVYLEDIAFQLYVYRAAGLDIRKAYLIFLDRNYVRGGDIDPQLLFRREDVTVQAEVIVSSLPAILSELSEVLLKSNSPEKALGPHCSKPYECSLTSHCWKDVPEDSIFTLTHAGDRVWTWWNAGIIRVVDLPATEKYSPRQLIQIAAERTQEVHVDMGAIQQFLNGLRYPLYFLDFETVMPAVPMFDGCRPYAQVPFQFSLHIQSMPNGELSHHEYLAEAKGDPRPTFIQALQSCLGSEGSIVCYNSGFETLRLKELAAHLPLSRDWIDSNLPRFIDANLLKPFQSYSVYNPSQHGSASIKAVLPAFTALSYGDLEIQEGGSASNQFLRLLKGCLPDQVIVNLRHNLLKYCERDTLAMVKLLETLWSMTRGNTTSQSFFPPAEVQGSAKPRVILMDDDLEILNWTAKCVQDCFKDAEVTAFQSALEGWEEMQRKAPDLLITDFYHPSPSGEEMLTLLAEQNVNFPILVISGGANEQLVRQCAGPNLNVSFLNKPWGIERLHEKLSTLIPVFPV